MRAEHDGGAQPLRLGGGCGHGLARPCVKDGDLGADGPQKAHQVAPLDAEAEDRNRQSAQRRVVPHRQTFSAKATPTMAPAMPTNQKRMTTCTSDQPISSKWKCTGAFLNTRWPCVYLK